MFVSSRGMVRNEHLPIILLLLKCFSCSARLTFFSFSMTFDSMSSNTVTNHQQPKAIVSELTNRGWANNKIWLEKAVLFRQKNAVLVDKLFFAFIHIHPRPGRHFRGFALLGALRPKEGWRQRRKGRPSKAEARLRRQVGFDNWTMVGFFPTKKCLFEKHWWFTVKIQDSSSKMGDDIWD